MALCLAPALPLAGPFTTVRSSASGSSSRARPAAARRCLAAAAQQQRQQRRQQAGLADTSSERASTSAAPAPSLLAAAAAASLAGGLALSPAALAAAGAADAPAAARALGELAALDSATAGALALVLKPALSLSSLLMIVRIVMSWYPEVDGKALPWSIAYAPTEPLLAATRKVVKPFNGLDVSPIVWVALLSFLSEILTGPQGILSLIARKGI